jgi:hypothetical protein
MKRNLLLSPRAIQYKDRTNLVSAHITAFIILLTVTSSLAQSIIQYNPAGNICVNSVVTFQYSGPCPAASLSWFFEGDGNGSFVSVTVEEQADKKVKVKWSSTTSTARLVGYCGSNPVLTASTQDLGIYGALGQVSAPSGISTRCQGGGTSNFSAFASNAASYSWGISLQGGLNSSLAGTISNTGVVTWNSAFNSELYGPVTIGVAAFGCAGSTTGNTTQVIVTPLTPVNVTISDPGPVCASSLSSLTFNVTNVTNAGSNPTYRWLRGFGGTTDAQDNESNVPGVYNPFYPLQAGEKIRCEVISSSSCTAIGLSDPVTITVITEEFPFLGNITYGPVCEGRQVTFQCGGRSGNWHVGSGGLPFNGSSYTVNVDDIDGEKIYFSTYVSGSCGGSVERNANTDILHSIPNPRVFANADELCTGETTAITLSSDIVGTTFNWTVAYQSVNGPTTPGTGATIAQPLTLISGYSGKAIYTVTATSPAGCVNDPFGVEATVYSLPSNPVLSAHQFCDFQMLTLTGQASGDIVDFRWFDAQENFLGQGLQHKVDIFPSGNYTFKFSAVSEYGCVSNVKTTLNVQVASQCNDPLNWIESMSYAPGEGPAQIVSHSKSYFDFTGNLLQTQVKNLTENEVMSSGSVQDEHGRTVLNSLNAPTGETGFYYKHWFLKDANGELYDHSLLGNPLGSFPNTVGWYYSAANTKETDVPQSQYPYTSIEFYNDGSGDIKKSGGPGEVHRVGLGHDVLTGTFPVYNELNDYLSVRRSALSLGDNVTGTSLLARGVQSVVRDENGGEDENENGNYRIQITDKSGNTVMTARNGTYQNNALAIPVSIASSADPQHENYRPVTYFYILADNTTVSISTGSNYVIEDLVSGSIYSPVGTSWKEGFYRVVLSSGSVDISYTNYFLDVSYQFYDDAGRLKSSLSPNGFKQLKTSSASYSSVDQTSYSYNHQGWLLYSKEPDAGETNYKYRSDGRIRFSQNAEQARTEKNDFSYTHYDQFGRPIESGEYFGSLPFANLQGQLEYAQQVIFTSSTRDWVKTHYDNPVESIPNLPVAEFKQQFVRGAVSWTENANIQTWYSYNELGRMVWMAQKPTALNRTFVVKYSYDFSGNVETVKSASYQNLTPSDEFYHHYAYDKDNRLLQAFTSLDGSNKKLRATYEYYLHGPLKRIELGDKLQGLDFVYNINGWLTQINHPNTGEDPGEDGKQNGLHPDFRKDVFGMVLDYYESSMNNLYTASATPSIYNMNLIHGLPQQHQQIASHQPLIRFNAIEDPSSSISNPNVFKEFSAENARYKKILSQD